MFDAKKNVYVFVFVSVYACVCVCDRRCSMGGCIQQSCAANMILFYFRYVSVGMEFDISIQFSDGIRIYP